MFYRFVIPTCNEASVQDLLILLMQKAHHSLYTQTQYKINPAESYFSQKVNGRANIKVDRIWLWYSLWLLQNSLHTADWYNKKFQYQKHFQRQRITFKCVSLFHECIPRSNPAPHRDKPLLVRIFTIECLHAFPWDICLF